MKNEYDFKNMKEIKNPYPNLLKNKYVYHFKRKNLAGKVLYPLNELKNVHPEVYNEQIKKYEGREEILKLKIPELSCLWNDVLHFSPINPQILLNEMRTNTKILEEKKHQIEVFKIPVNLLDEKKTVYYTNLNAEYGVFNQDLGKYDPFIINDYKEQIRVPERQIDQWILDKENKRPLFWFSQIIHVLSKTNLDTSNLEVIEIK